MYNNEHDALFIRSLLNYHTSTCFGRISSPSSGGTMYIQWNLGSRTPLTTNKSVHEQNFRKKKCFG
jgi:hypothetical protein